MDRHHITSFSTKIEKKRVTKSLKNKKRKIFANVWHSINCFVFGKILISSLKEFCNKSLQMFSMELFSFSFNWTEKNKNVQTWKKIRKLQSQTINCSQHLSSYLFQKQLNSLVHTTSKLPEITEVGSQNEEQKREIAIYRNCITI